MLNREEFVTLVAQMQGITKVQARNYIDAVIGSITKAFVDYDGVRFHGFGTFYTDKKPKRQQRMPDGSVITVDERVYPCFKAGDDLKRQVNQKKEEKK